MKPDKPLIAAVISAASTVVGELMTRACLMVGIGKYSMYELHSLLVTINRPSEAMGVIVGLVVGGFSGIVFYYALVLIGWDYLVAKSIGFSVLCWVMAELIFTATIEGHFIDIRPITDYYVHLFGAIGYGATTGILFKAYLRSPSDSKSTSELESGPPIQVERITAAFSGRKRVWPVKSSRIRAIRHKSPSAFGWLKKLLGL